MTILALWEVGDEDFTAYSLESESDENAFALLWKNKNRVDANFYNMDTKSYSDPLGQYGIMNADEFQRDYNDCMYDGEHWCIVLELVTFDIRKIVEGE